MALWQCLDCDTHYSVGALECPQCHSDQWIEVGMPKITKAEGPTNAAIVVPSDEVEEQPLVGNSSEQSSESTPSTKEETSSSPALFAENLTEPDLMESDTAHSTDTDQTESETTTPKRRRRY